MTSYLTFNDFFSLSGAVFKIFDFNLFRVWPWALTSKGHQRSKNFILFESPYVTSYLTSIDTFSLSRTVFEIFDFKLFRAWPLTSEGHPRSKIFILFESPYMTSYQTSIDTVFLSYRFWDIWLQTFQGLTLTFDLSRTSEVKCVHAIWKPIHDFRSNFHWHFLYLVLFLRYLISNILGFDLDRWPLKVIKGQKIFILFESPYVTSYLTSIDTSNLSNFHWHFLSYRFWDIWLQTFQDLTLTFDL